MKQNLLVLLCLLLINTACSAKYERLVHKTYAERVAVLISFYNDTLFRYNSKYAWSTVRELEQLAKDSNDNDLQMEVDIMHVSYDAHKLKYTMPVITAKIEALKKKAVTQNKIWAHAMLESLQAGYYYGRKEYELSFEHSQRVYELVKDMKVEDFPHKQYCIMYVGLRYFRFGDYRESLFYFFQALESEPKIILNKTPRRLTILNSIGLAYQHLGNLDSSDQYFNETYKLAANLHDSAFAGIACGNLGYNLFLRKKYDEAIPLLQKDVAIALWRKDLGLATGSLMALAEINLNRGNIAAAEEQMLQVKEFIFRSRQYNRLQFAYPLLAKLYIAKREPSLANIYMDSSFFWKDSIAKQFSSQRILRAKQKIELAGIKTEMKLADSKRKTSEVQRNMLVLFIIIAAAAGIYFYRLRARKIQLQKVLLHKTEHELVAATRQLNDFAKHISEKNELIEFLEQQNNLDNTETLEKLHKRTILTDDDWEYYRELFEKVHPGFFARLKEKVPGLTPAETRFMALSKLNLTGKEMAKILGIGTDAIRQYRSRVRRKMQLGEEDSLEELTSNI